MFKKYIENYTNEMIQNLQSLISIRSVSEPTLDTNKPFGDGANQALLYFLNLAKQLGFRTKNVDGYCGYAEFGEGEEILGIIGHLDIVPEGENWTYPPFSATIADNKIFGRGAIDDKGPVIASLYAMKAVKTYLEEHQLSLNKRVRIIVGLDEETNWECIRYYKQNEEIPSVSFSPDADFPCIYAEKSCLSEFIQMSYNNYLDSQNIPSKIILEHLEDHNNAINVVPKICEAILKIDIEQITLSDAVSTLNNLISRKTPDFKFDINTISDNKIHLISYGIQAHAAHPDLGTNAISRLLIVLNDFCENYNCPIPILSFFTKYINTEFDGYSFNIACEDESGKLTLNVGQLQFDGTNISLGLNLRVPVTTNPNDIHEHIQKLINNYSYMHINNPHINPALHLSKDDPLVKTLCKIYNETTHSNTEPIAIGGATFARAFPNCVSFGSNLPGQKDMCHQTDEFISIDNLVLASIMYAKAIFELAK